MKRAEQLFKSWAHRRASGFYSTSAEMADEMTVIGKAEECLYQSDKFHDEPGTFETYVHRFDSRPSVYAPHKNGGVPTLDLLGLKSWKADVAELGEMIELTFTKNDGSKKVLGFARGAALLGLTDKRTLIIIRPGAKPLVIKGGRMRITADGIAF